MRKFVSLGTATGGGQPFVQVMVSLPSIHIASVDFVAPRSHEPIIAKLDVQTLLGSLLTVLSTSLASSFFLPAWTLPKNPSLSSLFSLDDKISSCVWLSRHANSLVVPFLVMLRDEALGVQVEGDLGVDGLLGTLGLEWNRRLEDVVLGQIEFQLLGSA